MSAKELAAARDESLVLDVRDDSEFEEDGHIPGAVHLYVGYLDRHLDRLRRDLRTSQKVTLVCSVGHRAGLAASILRRHGVREVQNLLGGMTAWDELKLPTETGDERSVTAALLGWMRENVRSWRRRPGRRRSSSPSCARSPSARGPSGPRTRMRSMCCASFSPRRSSPAGTSRPASGGRAAR